MQPEISTISPPVGFACALLFAGLAYRIIKWVADAPLTPNPWDSEIERDIQKPDAVQSCFHCGAPQSSTAWFCPDCGNAVGAYNNLMPYLCIFSEGEILRNGTSGKVRPNAFIVFGYLVYSVGCYWILAPLFWIRYLLKLSDRKGVGMEEPPKL